MGANKNAGGLHTRPASIPQSKDLDSNALADQINTAPCLRDTIVNHAETHNLSLDSLTVMSAAVDPYRIDTPSNHRDSKWLAIALAASGARRPLHLRGLHYVLISGDPVIKPDGEPYRNTDDAWIWLQAVAGKARWLKYIPFEDFVDERSNEPIIYTRTLRRAPKVEIGSGVTFPVSFESMAPNAYVLEELHARQGYRLVMIGEKQSLEPVLLRVALRFNAELVLSLNQPSIPHRKARARRWASVPNFLLCRLRPERLAYADRNRAQGAGAGRRSFPRSRHSGSPNRAHV